MTQQEAFLYFESEHAYDYRHDPGHLPVLFSAPHTYEHPRNGRMKPAERASGVLARLLASETGCHAFYKSRTNEDDPNHNAFSPYRDALFDCVKSNGIRFLIDLHELHPARSQLVNPLIDGGKNISGHQDAYLCLKEHFLRAGFPVSEDVPFAGKTRNRVAADLSRRTGIFALQLELNANLLYPEFRTYRLRDVADILKEVVSDLVSR